KAEGGSAGTRLPESRIRKLPGPLEFRALLSHCPHRRTRHPGKTVVPKSRARQLAERPPGLVRLRTWASHPIMSRRTNCAAVLIPRCRPEPDDQFSRNPAAILDVDTLRLRPFTDFRGVQPACRRPASGPSRPTRRGATAAPRGVDITRQRLAERLGVLGVQVDLILGTIQRKADGPLCLTTIDVIDEQGLYLLSHVYSVPLVE